MNTQDEPIDETVDALKTRIAELELINSLLQSRVSQLEGGNGGAKTGVVDIDRDQEM